MSYRNVVAIAFAAMISTFGCGKNLMSATDEIVKSEATMEAGNLEVSMPLPEWLKAKLSALPASKLAGDPGEGPLSIYVTIVRASDDGVETQKFPLIPNMANGVASGVARVDVGEVTVQAFYHEIGQGTVDFQSKPIALTIASKKKYQITFHMERVSDGNVSFSAIWDNTPEEVVVVDDTTPIPPTPTPEPVVGSITITKNTAFDDRSASMPTGVAGATNVKIASFVITSSATEAAYIISIPLITNQLGSNFQNLKLVNNNIQIGEAISSLDISDNAETYVYFSYQAGRIPSGAQYVTDVFADIKSSPRDIGVLLSPVVTIGQITATGENSGQVILSNTDVLLQNGYISAGGRLTITAVDTPPDQVLAMGETDKEVFKFKLAAGIDEDVLANEIHIGCETESLIPGGTLMTAKLYNGSIKLGEANWTKWTGPFSADYFVVGFRNLSILVPRNSSARLTLKVDVGTSGDAISGFKARFVLYPDYDGEVAGDQSSITAIGISSAIALTGDALKFQGIGGLGTGVTSNEITVYATRISVAWASAPPSGSFVPQAGQVVAKFTITNSGRYSASIKHINTMVRVSGSHAISQANLAIYKDVVSSANLVSSIDVNFVFNEVSITSGASTTFIVTLDTNNLGLVPGESVSVSIPSDGIIWQDGVGAGNITGAEGLPLSPKTLIY